MCVRLVQGTQVHINTKANTNKDKFRKSEEIKKICVFASQGFRNRRFFFSCLVQGFSRDSFDSQSSVATVPTSYGDHHDDDDVGLFDDDDVE